MQKAKAHPHQADAVVIRLHDKGEIPRKNQLCDCDHFWIRVIKVTAYFIKFGDGPKFLAVLSKSFFYISHTHTHKQPILEPPMKSKAAAKKSSFLYLKRKTWES